jgi:hypothetical protein
VNRHADQQTHDHRHHIAEGKIRKHLCVV